MRRLAIWCTVHALALPAIAQTNLEAEDAAPVTAGDAPAAQAAAARKPLVQHLPIHEVFAGEGELRFRVSEPDHAGALVVHCVPGKPGGHGELTATAKRGEALYFASVPEPCAQPPGFTYWVEREGEHGTQPVFASRSAPHAVRVAYRPEVEREREQLQAHGFRRSSFLLALEGVDFGYGSTAPGAATAHDRYYRIEAGYAYAFFATIEDIALTVVRVRGDNGLAARPNAPAPLDPGIDYGRAAVTLAPLDLLRVRAALLLGASQEGFEYGAGGEVVLGDPRAEYLALGAQTLTTLGTTAHIQLGFDATSVIPMAARVEVTDFPLGQDTAIRLLYEVGYRFGPATELRLRGGYQGHTSVAGGASLGAALRYGF